MTTFFVTGSDQSDLAANITAAIAASNFDITIYSVSSTTIGSDLDNLIFNLSSLQKLNFSDVSDLPSNTFNGADFSDLQGICIDSKTTFTSTTFQNITQGPSDVKALDGQTHNSILYADNFYGYACTPLIFNAATCSNFNAFSQYTYKDYNESDALFLTVTAVNEGPLPATVGSLTILPDGTILVDSLGSETFTIRFETDGGLVGARTITINPFTSSDGPISISDLHGGPVCANSFFDIFFSLEGVSDAYCTLTFNNSDYVSDVSAGSHFFNVEAPSVASDYEVTLRAQNLLNPNCSDFKTAIIIVDASVSDLTITVSPSDMVCSGSSVTLTASGADHYVWFDGFSDNPHTFTPSETSDYGVTGYSQSEVCFSDTVITITVDTPVSDLTITADSNIVCLGNSVTLTASGADHYLWFDGSSDNPHAFIPNQTSDYKVTGYSQNEVCFSDAVITITVKTPVTVDAGSDQTIAAGSSTIIGVGPALSDVLYIWSPAAGVSDIHAFPTTVTPTSDTIYTVIAQRTDCAASDSVTLTLANEALSLTQAGIINVGAVGSLLDFSLIVSPEAAASLPVGSDIFAIFSDICVYADAQDCKSFLAGLKINASSDLLCSDALILQHPEIVVVSCSDNVLHLDDDDGNFTFSITDFMSDTIFIQYEDMFCQISDVMTWIGGSFSLQTSDTQFIWIDPCNSDAPNAFTNLFDHPLLAIDGQGDIVDIGFIDCSSPCQNPTSDLLYVSHLKAATVKLGNYLETHFSDYTSHISDQSHVLYLGPITANLVTVDIDNCQLIFSNFSIPFSDVDVC